MENSNPNTKNAIKLAKESNLEPHHEGGGYCMKDSRHMCRWVRRALKMVLQNGEASDASPTYQELKDSHDETTCIINHFYRNASESCLRQIEKELFLAAQNCCPRHANIVSMLGHD